MFGYLFSIFSQTKPNLLSDLPNDLILEVLSYLDLYDVNKLMGSIKNRELFKLYKDLLNGSTISFGPNIMNVCTSDFCYFIDKFNVKIRDWPESMELSFAFFLIDRCYDRSDVYFTCFTSILDNPEKYNYLMSSDCTLLMRACQRLKRVIVEYLFEIGVDFQKKYRSTYFWTCSDLVMSLEIVSKLGSVHIFEYLLSVYPNMRKDVAYVEEACKENHIDTVRFLLSRGWSVQCSDKSYYALLIAFNKRNIEIMKLLLESGADANYLLCLACQKGDLMVIDLSLQYGAKKSDLFDPPYKVLMRSGKRFDNSNELYQKIIRLLLSIS